MPPPAASGVRGERLRVSVVTETWAPEVNGVALTLRRMLRWLDERHTVTLVRPEQGRADAGEPLVHGRTVTVPGLGLPRYPGLRLGLPATTRLRRCWEAAPPDVVHVITEGPLGWSAVRAATRLGLPVISDFHTNFHRYLGHYQAAWLRPLALRYLRRLHNATDLTLVPTECVAAELQRQGFQGLDLLPRGIDTGVFHPARRSAALRNEWGAAPGAPVLLAVGRIAPEKNLGLACETFLRVRQRHPDAVMVVVGDGPSRDVLQRRYPGVRFVGAQRGEQLAESYASADLFLFPSETDTFGNVVLEAMSSGLAVVAYDAGAARRHIVDGINGLRVPFGAADAFVAAALSALDDELSVRRIGRAARMAVGGLDWETVCQRYQQYLLQAVAGRD